MMTQIPYSSSAAPVRLEYPEEWDPAAITGLTLTVTDRGGATLLAATSVTRYTATSLNGDVDQFASSIVLDSGASNLSIGDPLLIVGILGREKVRVRGFDTATKTAELEAILQNEYDDGDSVYGCFADYSLDVSTVATFTAGMIINLIWTPTGTGGAFTQQAQIAATSLEIAGLRQYVADKYPRAYKSFSDPADKFDRMAKIAEDELTVELLASNPPIAIQRIVNTDLVKASVAARMALDWAIAGDDNMEDERKVIGGEYEKHLGWLRQSVVWTDDDMDGIEDDGELRSSEPYFDNGW